jgi:hypothetical protein
MRYMGTNTVSKMAITLHGSGCWRRTLKKAEAEARLMSFTSLDLGSAALSPTDSLGIVTTAKTKPVQRHDSEAVVLQSSRVQNLCSGGLVLW